MIAWRLLGAAGAGAPVRRHVNHRQGWNQWGQAKVRLAGPALGTENQRAPVAWAPGSVPGAARVRRSLTPPRARGTLTPWHPW